MLFKTEWSWELRTWSHKMNLLDILSTSPHCFCRKWTEATNENSNFDLRVYRVKSCNLHWFGESNLFWFSLFCSPIVKVLTRLFCLVLLRLSLQTSVCLYLTLSLPECLMEFCKVTFEYADEILWCDHSNESSLPVLTHDAICSSKFHEVKFGNLLSVKFGSERANREKKSRGITITIIVITVTTSLSLSQPWSFFSSPSLKSLAFHHLCSPHQCDTGGWPAWGYAHRRHISGRLFSEGEKRRPEMRLLFAGQLGVTRTDFNIRHCVFSPNWSLPLSWFTVGFKSPSPLNLQHFVQRLSYNFLRLVWQMSLGNHNYVHYNHCHHNHSFRNKW